MKLIFAGTPDFAAAHLRALLASEHEICAVYTQPDRPSGRGKKLSPSPVKALAVEHGLPVLQPQSLKTPDAQEALAAFDCDLMVVVAYGLILPKAVLDTPKLGCINVHGSILPRWRGAAPIQRAIEAGDASSGVTIMQMDVGLDTGDMLIKSECPILESDTAGSLHDRLIDIGQPALLQALDAIAQGKATAEKQDDALSNYAAKIEKAESQIDWSEDAVSIQRKIRAFNPFPMCFTTLRGQRLRIQNADLIDDASIGQAGAVTIEGAKIIVQCGRGKIAVETLQLAGKKSCDSKAFINGFGQLIPSDTVLGQE
ncbi:MAG: methionyl-tRNA formyltransferase [Agarilytica sp.]